MDSIQVTDDFERFCQIAQRSPRDSLTPTIHITQPNQTHITVPYNEVEVLKRASSFRETRRKSNTPQHNNFSGEMSTTRSPVRSVNERHECSTPVLHGRMQLPKQPMSISRSPYLLEPKTDPNNYWSHSNSYRDSIDMYNASPINLRAYPSRQRAGSMKERSRKSVSVDRHGSRPSAPTLNPANLPLALQYSTSRHSITQPTIDEQILRVRRFERNKHGRLISKGDRDIPQIELFTSHSPSGESRMSIAYPQSAMEDNTRSSNSSMSDNEVIEIPAITRGVRNSSVKHSNHSLNKFAKSDIRSRSKSWGMVFEKENELKRDSINEFEQYLSENLLHIQVVGTARVGKTSICMQFRTSESIEELTDLADQGQGDEDDIKPIRVEFNNLKASLIFMESDINADEIGDGYNLFEFLPTADAYLVVYAVDDRASFLSARKIIGYLLSQCKRSSAIILAANKSDLVRTRVVSSEEGKNLAEVYSCSIFEISTSLNHKVDDLLVGILMAIRKQQKDVLKERDRLDRLLEHGRRDSHSSPKRHKSSLVNLKSPANSVKRFFRKYFNSSNVNKN